MGRHHQHVPARRAHVSLGAATLVGLVCSTGYALGAPAVPAVVPAAVPVAPAAAVVPAATAGASTTCDLSGPPVFGDPAHPNRITNRACGTVDAQGRERSRDPWIDAQLVGAAR